MNCQAMKIFIGDFSNSFQKVLVKTVDFYNNSDIKKSQTGGKKLTVLANTISTGSVKDSLRIWLGME